MPPRIVRPTPPTNAANTNLPVPGWPSYRVCGTDIVSLHGGNRKILNPHKDNYGYLIVGLYEGTTRKSVKVHRLIMLASAT